MKSLVRLRRETVILRWRGEAPVLAAMQYVDNLLFFFCEECKMYHYHRASDNLLPARCVKETGLRKTGYFLEVLAL